MNKSQGKLADELRAAIIAGREASQEIMAVYEKNDFAVDYKEDDSPLTEADRRANEVIVKSLQKKFPRYAILAEESSDDKTRLDKDWCWIIDPLDGTKEFVKRNGEFTVNIALVYRQKPVLGVINVPVTGELYYAAKGRGARYRPEKETACREIAVSDKVDDLRAVKSRSHASEELNQLLNNTARITEVKERGSSLKGCLIARGEAEIYYRFNPTMEWDVAAMDCIIREAGGIMRNLKTGERMKYNRENSVNEDGFYVVNREENALNTSE
ncbi:3'(2'),5'-bisphosphate nucleotidase [Halarsenatibacter silvermanii]|uniref:3'(2'),5'-bisphosphate nucleotidase CysQ n=2 Tax=Halarsenatibacter silvermanii TaxID=321763 RepID=A0A1G9TXM9_9FIRM|nr:3'(2'),5'-bisphosphate nucleotidase [Halarsenatibacter silvermanii]